MEQRTINNEVWGRVMMGKDHNIPTYRKLVDGKMKPVAGNLVPEEVKDAFLISEQPDTPPLPEVADAISEPAELLSEQDVNALAQNADNTKRNVNSFGFNGKDNDPTPIEENDMELIDELQAESIHNATLFDLCQELYNRFGIYTCYLQREPNQTDVHPVTGNLMTNFTLGQTRTQYMIARKTGASFNEKVMESVLKSKDQVRFDFTAHRAMHPEHFERPATEEERNLTVKEWQALRMSEKPIMATEHGRRGDGTDEDELYAEPPINGKTIRPYPSNPIAERRLAEQRARNKENGGRF